MSTPILSICIPTYERRNDLYQCLISILKLKNEIINKIEICVSDNCSSYDFKAFMSAFSAHDNIIYKVNRINLGFDKNILELINMASGKYIMLLGNDDVVIEDGILELIDIMERLTPDAIFSNYKVTLTDNNYSYDAYKFSELRSGLKFDWVLNNLKEKCGFISSIVIKKSCLAFDKIILDKFIGGGFIHMALAFEGLKESTNVAYSPRSSTNAFDKNATTYNIKKVFLDNLGFIVNSYSKDYDIKSINSFKYGALKHVVFSRDKILLRDLIKYKFVTTSSLFLLLLSKGLLLNIVIATRTFAKKIIFKFK